MEQSFEYYLAVDDEGHSCLIACGYALDSLEILSVFSGLPPFSQGEVLAIADALERGATDLVIC